MLRSALYSIRMEDCDDLRGRAPARDVVLDELHVEDRSRQIAFERQGVDAEHRLHVLERHRDIDVKWFSGIRHVRTPFESRRARGGRTCERRQTPSYTRRVNNAGVMTN